MPPSVAPVLSKCPLVNLTGDTVNIASGQTLLRAWKSDVGPGYELSGPLYTPSASAVTVTLSFFVSATSTAANTIVVTLPFPVKMYDLAASPAEILAADGATPTKDNCDSVIRVIPSGSTIARTLVAPGAGVAPCVLSGSGTTITLTLDTTVSSYATGDRIDVGFGNSANLRGAATAAAVANTSPKYTTVATLNAAASAAVVTIGPSIVSAAAASPTQVKVTLSATGTITTTPATVDDCNKIVTFTPAKTLAATSPCSVAGTTLTVNLDKATPYAGTDAVNIAAANSLAATTNPLKAGSLAFVAKATAVTIDPNLYTATAIDSLVYEVALPAASSVGSTALTAAQCGAILSLTGGRTISSTVTAPCVLDTTKTLLTVSLGTAYADGKAGTWAAGAWAGVLWAWCRAVFASQLTRSTSTHPYRRHRDAAEHPGHALAACCLGHWPRLQGRQHSDCQAHHRLGQGNHRHHH